MKLELLTYQVEKVEFASRNNLSDHVLHINKRELEKLLSEDRRLKGVKVDLVSPGEPVRIINVLDIIEPRIKVKGPGCTFPGFLGPPQTVGEGTTRRLSGVSVIEAGKMWYQEGSLLSPREQIIDMFGPGAHHTPFAKSSNLVLSFDSQEGTSTRDYDRAIHLAGLKVATYLAEISKDASPDRREVFELAKISDNLPKVVYICQVSSTGPLVDTFLYGEPMRGQLPTLIHPNELMDGAIVNGHYRTCTIRTYVHCNNPIIGELYRFHGVKLNFAGMVLTVGGGITQSTFAKERSAYYTAKLARFLEADAALLTQQSAGNSIMDQMLICRHCEDLGIKTTVLTYEMPGTNGTDPPLIYMAPEADAVVTLGNKEEKVWLPPVEKVIGGDKFLDKELSPYEGLELSLEEIAGSIDPTGFGRLTAKQY